MSLLLHAIDTYMYIYTYILAAKICIGYVNCNSFIVQSHPSITVDFRKHGWVSFPPSLIHKLI